MNEQSPDLFSLQIDPLAESYLREAARWGKFLAIVGFVMCGLLVLLGFFAGAIMTTIFSALPMGGGMPMGAAGGIGGTMFIVLYALIALIYFFPCLYLYNFSTKVKTALAASDQQILNASFKNLKSMFRFVGILTLICLCFYALIIIFAIIGMAVAGR